jgi:hypothetical protein
VMTPVRHHCCVNWVLTPFIIRHVNLFFMLSAVTLAGSFAISGVNHHV